jgi:hypothetical protein
VVGLEGRRGLEVGWDERRLGHDPDATGTRPDDGGAGGRRLLDRAGKRRSAVYALAEGGGSSNSS